MKDTDLGVGKGRLFESLSDYFKEISLQDIFFSIKYEDFLTTQPFKMFVNTCNLLCTQIKLQ